MFGLLHSWQGEQLTFAFPGKYLLSTIVSRLVQRIKNGSDLTMIFWATRFFYLLLLLFMCFYSKQLKYIITDELCSSWYFYSTRERDKCSIYLINHVSLYTVFCSRGDIQKNLLSRLRCKFNFRCWFMRWNMTFICPAGGQLKITLRINT